MMRISIFLLALHLFVYKVLLAQGNIIIPNKGQIENSVKGQQVIAYAEHALGTIYILNDRIRFKIIKEEDHPNIHKSLHYQGLDTQFTVSYQVVDMIFNNSEGAKTTIFENPADYYLNFYLGNNPQDWISKLKLYQKLTLKNVYPNIDFSLYLDSTSNAFEFDWILREGANSSNISMSFDGNDSIQLIDNYLNIISTNARFKISPPKAYQIINNHKNWLLSSFFIDKNQIIKLKHNKPIDEHQPLIIDPILVFSTYSGSQADNFGFTATYDEKGCLYAGGIVDANSRTYPVTTGAFQTTYGGSSNQAEPVYLPCDISISKYSADGSTLLYATYIGGSNNEYPHSLCTNLDNELIVMGSTLSQNFPIHPDFSIQSSKSTGSDLILIKLSEDGSVLLGGTFLGGQFDDAFQTNSGNRRSNLLFNYADNYRGDVTADKYGNIYVASCSQSTDLIMAQSLDQTTINDKTDAWIFSTTPNLSQLRWGTFIGGSEDDAAYSCRFDSKGNLFIGGGTLSVDFPFADNTGYMQTYKDGTEGFIVKLNPDNGKWLKGTLWRGDLPPVIQAQGNDQIYFIDLDPDDKVYFTAQTTSGVSRTSGTYGDDLSPQAIGCMTNDLDSLIWQTTFGNPSRGIPDLSPSAFMVDECYNIYFSGWGSNIGVGNPGTTDGLEITSDAHQNTTDGNDFYLIALSKDAQNLLYASYFGGDQSEDHVDGGTSRFDKRGIVYQSVCASCPNSPPGLNDFPTTTGAAFEDNVSIRCSNASFKLDFRLGYSIDAEFTTSSVLCLGLTHTFNPIRQYNAEYKWDFGDGNSSTFFNPTHTYDSIGKYKVTLTVTDTNSCNVRSIFDREIEVVESPKASIEHYIEPCEAGVYFEIKGNYFDSIFWFFGDGNTDSTTEPNTYHNYNMNATYYPYVYLKNSKTGCRDTIDFKVIDSSFMPEEFNLTNVITPNNDGLNDCWEFEGISIKCEKAEIYIYNRWGAEVYYSTNPTICWNGKVSNTGVDVPSGTYFYIIRILETAHPEYPKEISGSINVIRDPN